MSDLKSKEPLEGARTGELHDSWKGMEAYVASLEDPGDDALLHEAWRAMEAQVLDLPLRYAPFFAQMGEMSGLPADVLEQDLARARDERAWKWTPFSGVRFFALTPPSLDAPECILVRFPEGGQFPEHTHLAQERTLVLEGGYRDSEGREFHAGDRDDAGPGARHTLEVLPGGPCVTFVSMQGRFVVEPLWPRLLLKLFWQRRTPQG